jgi:6-phosphogluconolactonase (cycloisomerase 2 family)
MHQVKIRAGLNVLLAVAVLFSAFVWGGGAAFAEGHAAGAIYVLTNDAAHNAVKIFNRAADGTLTPAASVATGGQGTGAGLGSQGALVLSEDNNWLFAVNAGSNEISVFDVESSGLRMADKVASGGSMPISLTAHDDVLYVLNAGSPANITGFRVGKHGHLTPIAHSTQPLSAADPAPAEVSFNPDGDLLVVTEKGTNKIDTYVVDRHGLAAAPVVHNSVGMTPFGFAYGKRNQLIVSEAFGGAPGASAVSSYRADEDSPFTVLSGSVPNGQGAACWVAISHNGRYAYISNTGSGTVSSYSIAHNGTLTLLNAHAGQMGAGSKPADSAFSQNGRFLYVLGEGSFAVSAFQFQSDGSLTPLAGASGLPMSTVGLAAR